jgi:hypothetical protein
MPRKIDDRVRLLHGPYEAPPLRVGDRATCLFRDCDVVMTGWTDARISWPRCRPLDVPRSHPSLLVNEDLARAIRQESAAALTYWWGTACQTYYLHRYGILAWNPLTRIRRPGAISDSFGHCYVICDRGRAATAEGGMSVLRTRWTSACARRTMCPQRRTPRREFAQVCPTRRAPAPAR